ncbi:hypothetical protein GCM10022254_64420 [Actinomadura meridiana]|uniref:Uncharacterized protein n=1 Tax=Actinomadura meridiana TaxID=559626 RepID=A0ABP8CKN8_9ACTN
MSGWAVTILLATPLAGRERSRPCIIAMLLCGQMVLHVVFCLGQPPAPDSPPEGSTGGAPAVTGHTMPGGTDAHGMGGHGMGGHGMGGHGMGGHMMPGLTMFVVHLAAAFLLGWVVHRGERAVWQMVRLSARSAGPLTALFSAVLTRRATPCPPDMRIRTLWQHEEKIGPGETVLLDHALIRRGPPLVKVI